MARVIGGTTFLVPVNTFKEVRKTSDAEGVGGQAGAWGGSDEM
jgi:hypothetical protein